MSIVQFWKVLLTWSTQKKIRTRKYIGPISLLLLETFQELQFPEHIQFQLYSGVPLPTRWHSISPGHRHLHSALSVDLTYTISADPFQFLSACRRLDLGINCQQSNIWNCRLFSYIPAQSENFSFRTLLVQHTEVHIVFYYTPVQDLWLFILALKFLQYCHSKQGLCSNN